MGQEDHREILKETFVPNSLGTFWEALSLAALPIPPKEFTHISGGLWKNKHMLKKPWQD